MIALAIVGGVLVVALLLVGTSTVLNWILRRKKESESNEDS